MRNVIEEAEDILRDRVEDLELEQLDAMAERFEMWGMSESRAMEMALHVLEVSKDCGFELYIEAG